MSAIAKKKLTEAEYLAIERAAEFRSEFYNGEMFAMAGTDTLRAIRGDSSMTIPALNAAPVH